MEGLLLLFFIPFVALAAPGFLNKHQPPTDGYLLQQHSFYPESRMDYWAVSGSTVIHQSHIALTPDEKSMTGQLWNQKPFLMSKDWEVHLRLVIGRYGSFGADGLAFWYTTTQGTEGTVFGNTDRFEGLGIFFDSFDNDGSGDHPLIYAILGDGVTPYDGASDGATQRIGSCTSRYRTSVYDHNAHKNPTHVIIRYARGILSVHVDLNHFPEGAEAYTRCFEIPVDLKRSGYFGLTAATGGLSDHHDVVSMSTYSLISTEYDRNREEEPQQNNFAQPENNFAKQENNFAQQNQQHHEANPDSVPQPGAGTGSEQKVSTFVREAQDRQSRFFTSLNAQFKSLTDKFVQMEKVTSDSLHTVEEAAATVSAKLTMGKKSVDTLRSDIATLTELSTSLRETLAFLEKETEDILKETQKHSNTNEQHRAQLAKAVESHSFGFWLLFILFQIFFIMTVIYWNQSKKTTSRFR